MYLIDTHCHLSSSPENISSAVSNAVSSGVKQMLCIGAGVGDNPPKNALDIANKYPDVVYASAGIHPLDAFEDANVEVFSSYLSNPKVLAVGETGLDFYYDKSPREHQIRIFKDSIRLAKEHKLPLIIHSRDAGEETLRILKEERAEEVGGVFHCYGESLDFAKKVFDINFIVSFTGVVTFKNGHNIRSIVKDIPLGSFMLETDSPYMAPEPFRGKPSEPAHVKYIADKIAEVKGISLNEVATETTKAATKLFGFKPLEL